MSRTSAIQGCGAFRLEEIHNNWEKENAMRRVLREGIRSETWGALERAWQREVFDIENDRIRSQRLGRLAFAIAEGSLRAMTMGWEWVHCRHGKGRIAA